jgi:hypothetical protein
MHLSSNRKEKTLLPTAEWRHMCRFFNIIVIICYCLLLFYYYSHYSVLRNNSSGACSLFKTAHVTTEAASNQESPAATIELPFVLEVEQD